MEGFAESISGALGSQDVQLVEVGKYEEIFQKTGHSHAEHVNEGHEHEYEDYVLIIDGLADHYHTGDAIKLTASHSEDLEHDHWHWFTLDPDSEEWEVVEGQSGHTYEGEATVPGQQIKAVLYDDNHAIISESDPKIITIDDHMDYDPHIWTDPLRVIQVAEILKDELITLNPDGEDLYHENFDILKSKLIDLDEKFIDLLEMKENKYIIVLHAAFGYWEERYGVKQIAISGLSAGKEPSQKELTEVIKVAEEYDLEYILYEQNSDSRLSKVIQEQIGAESLTIHNLEVRTEKEVEKEKDYISLMENNLKVLDQVTK